jgi:hypothetical protein
MTTSIEQTLPYQISDISVIIPLYVDHEDRLTNLNTLLNYLESVGIHNIFINEHFSETPKGGGAHHMATYIGDAVYNKMKCVNEAFECCRGRIVAIWDVDVIFPKSSIYKTIELFNLGSDVVYPYNGQFYNVPKIEFSNLWNGEINMSKCELCNPNSYGGCVMIKREVFENGGKGNPNIQHVGFDDNEIYVRFYKLGYTINRVDAPLFHMEHFRSETAVENTPYLNANMRIYNQICAMSKEQLINEITAWK